MLKLKHCPFCGSQASESSRSLKGEMQFYISCSNCDASTDCYDSTDVAAEKWNARIDTQPIEDFSLIEIDDLQLLEIPSTHVLAPRTPNLHMLLTGVASSNSTIGTDVVGEIYQAMLSGIKPLD
jgi:Lar family restriction alleviation protein